MPFQIPSEAILAFGKSDLITKVSEPFSIDAVGFLDALSKELFKSCDKSFTDVLSFAFFCRKANLTKLKEDHESKHTRLGRGFTFHIAPSNVPINFAFSFAFSILAGNLTNVVRLPSKDFKQVAIIVSALNALKKSDASFKSLDGLCLIKYDHEKTVTDYFSSVCQARVIWGGDETVKEIRKSEIPVRSTDIGFSDRYSFCVIDSLALEKATEKDLAALSQGFYNDTYFIDQNACSSPSLIIWKKGAKSLDEVKKKFYLAVGKLASEKYALQPISAVDKLSKAYELAATRECKTDLTNKTLYVTSLKTLPSDIDTLREKCGFFFEYDAENLADVCKAVNIKYQTVTYFGDVADELKAIITKNSLLGIDRIVPIGKALDIGTIWDGYDLINTLSRIIK